MKQPTKEDYGFVSNNQFDGEPSGWVLEGGEEAYAEALVLWENEDDINDEDTNAFEGE